MDVQRAMGQFQMSADAAGAAPGHHQREIIERQFEEDDRTTLQSITWLNTTAPLGGSIDAEIVVSHEVGDANVGRELRLIGYVADLMDPNAGEDVRDTVVLDETRTYTLGVSIPIPNDPAFLGDQWTYVGIEGGPGTHLRGNGVTITEGDGTNGGGNGGNGNGQDGDVVAGLGQGTLLVLGGLAALAYALSQR